MNHKLFKILTSLLIIGASGLPAIGQVSSSSSLSGVVMDASGAVVPGAEILVKNDATGAELLTTSAGNGTFMIPAVPAGTYTVTVTVPSFKQAVIKQVKVDIGVPASVTVKLEVGAQTETVEVTSGAEVLQTQTANVSVTIQGSQVTALPFTSRDALDLVLFVPGSTTTGRPRTTSVAGLPKGSLNVTIDGVNVQDNNLKSSDGFYTFIRPRTDAMEEVTVSTATPGAESAGEGAVQIKFVTRQGSNNFHGSLYEYHRNPSLAANYWFNNRDLPADPRTGKAPRDRVLLNQFGARVGGPITIPGLFSGRDRAFFFINQEFFTLPQQTSRQRIVLNPTAQKGVLSYVTGQGTRSVDVLALAASKGFTSTIDPTIGATLAQIRNSTGGAGLTPLDVNKDQFTFVNGGSDNRVFTTGRFDFNLTSKHHLEEIFNYQIFRTTVDFLNSRDPAFPGLLAGVGGLNSNRRSNSVALRSTLTPRLINEVRFGFQGGTVLFASGSPNSNPAAFAATRGFAFGTGATSTTTGFGAAIGITNPLTSRGNSRRNSPAGNLIDTVTYVRGSHSISLGANMSQVGTTNEAYNNLVPYVNFGTDTSDPANTLFTTANFPGASGTDLNNARGLYGLLTGRVTSINANAYIDKDTGKYTYLGDYWEKIRQREFSIFAADSWRIRPNLTVTGGLRWDVQFPYTSLLNSYSQTSFDGVYGISGLGNLFKPGTMTGKITQFNAFTPGTHAYNTDWKTVGPSAGFAWSPRSNNSVLRRLFGNAGQSAFRAGYSLAFVREGTNVLQSVVGSNPGGSFAASRTIVLGNLTPGTLFRDVNTDNAAPPIPSAPQYPLTGATSTSTTVFSPNLRAGYAQSWTFGFQREITKNMVLEARYTGTRGVKLWRLYDLNEVNLIENGFLNEFKLAQANLKANIAAGKGTTFAYTGIPGTSPLPITLAYFNGIAAPQAGDPSKYSSSNFTSSTFLTPLSPAFADPYTFANNLGGPLSAAARRTNALAAGLPANFFVVNPDYLGGSRVVDNGGASWYNGLTVELRRRLSTGLLFQASYTYSQAMTTMNSSSSSDSNSYTTLRNPSFNKTLSPWNIRHGLKFNWVYSLPFGKGMPLLSHVSGWADRVVGGWEIMGTARIQSGSPFNLVTSGTTAGSAVPVRLVNMTVQDLRNMVQIRKDPNKIVFLFPDSVILNTRKAWSVTPTGYSALGAPDSTAQYIAPATSDGCLPGYPGQCGFSNVILFGPHFTRFDISIGKKVKFSERADFELRAEFLNAFNNINFLAGDPANDVNTITNFSAQTFGQTTSAYRDLSTTNDPGGRLIQFVARINF